MSCENLIICLRFDKAYFKNFRETVNSYNIYIRIKIMSHYLLMLLCNFKVTMTLGPQKRRTQTMLDYY